MRISSMIGGVVLAILAIGCAGKSQQAASQEQVAPEGPVIVRLVGQHQQVTVTSGPDGPLYTAQTIDGKTIVANASLAELRVNHPEVYQFVEPAMAADASVGPGRVPTDGKRSFKSGASQKDVFMLDSAR